MTASSGNPDGSVPLSQPKKRLILTVGANLGITGLTVITGTLNARLLGPSGRGELAAIQTMPSMIGAVAALGLPSAVAYFSARRPGEARTLILTAALLCVLAAIPAVALGYLFMPRLLASQSAGVVHSARIYLSFILLQAVVTLPYVTLQGLGRFGVWNLLRLAPNVASVAAIGIACFTGPANAGRFSGCYLFTYALIAPLAFRILWANSTKGGKPTVGHARELFRYGLPSALMIPAGMLNLQMDQVLMAAWMPSHLLGLYAVSVSWAAMLSPAFAALGQVIFPALAATQDVAAQRALVARSFRLGIIAALFLATGLMVTTPILLPLIFGRQFAPAVPAALILVAAGVILNLNNLSGEILRGLGVPRWPLLAQLAALPVTVTLLVTLLPRWTIVGAAVASLAAYTVAGLMCIVGVLRTSGIRPRELLVPTVADGRVFWDLARRVIDRVRS